MTLVLSPDMVRRFEDTMRAEGIARRAEYVERVATRRLEGRTSMATCSLRPVYHGPRTCDGCGGPLTGKRRRWCSEACSDRWWANHSWGYARWEAIRRSSGFTAEQLEDVGQGRYSTAFCDECGRHTGGPEVNHVEPRNGGGYGPGCHHHQTNLQVLCHDCHVAETTRQRRERAGLPLEGPAVQPKPEPGIPIWDFAS